MWQDNINLTNRLVDRDPESFYSGETCFVIKGDLFRTRYVFHGEQKCIGKQKQNIKEKCMDLNIPFEM